MREPSLDPVRRPRLPRRGATLRGGLVAALLLTAAGALYLPEPPPAPCPPPVTPTASTRDGDGRLAVPAGAVGVPVRLAEPAALALLRPGDRVDLLAVGQPPAVIAADALVLDVAGAEGALFLAVRSDQARRAAGAPPDTRFTVIVRP